MIDPTKVTNYNRTENELQEFLLFCIVVAGKNSHQQAIKLDKFIKDLLPQYLARDIFEAIRLAYPIFVGDALKRCKMGQYTRITKAFCSVARLRDLKAITVNELEKVKGIGPKTARFFILHSRPNQHLAVLDTHILRWMREQGYNAPKATPPLKRYLELEQNFLCEAYNRRMNPADLDLQIWKEKSQKSLTT